jgi:N-methylhydantoinase B/oxoprolinase/acetone carboxylase alpha subunit
MPTGMIRWKLPEEENEFRSAQDGHLYRLILQDLDEHLRMTIKHSNKPKAEIAAYQALRDMLLDMVKDYGVELWI